jgi:hypothetical protein
VDFDKRLRTLGKMEGGKKKLVTSCFEFSIKSLPSVDSMNLSMLCRPTPTLMSIKFAAKTQLGEVDPKLKK